MVSDGTLVVSVVGVVPVDREGACKSDRGGTLVMMTKAFSEGVLKGTLLLWCRQLIRMPVGQRFSRTL